MKDQTPFKAIASGTVLPAMTKLPVSFLRGDVGDRGYLQLLIDGEHLSDPTVMVGELVFPIDTKKLVDGSLEFEAVIELSISSEGEITLQVLLDESKLVVGNLVIPAN